MKRILLQRGVHSHAGQLPPSPTRTWVEFPLSNPNSSPILFSGYCPAEFFDHTATIADAIRASGADGTRSILDLDHVSPHPAFLAVSPVDPSQLQQWYGTTQPTRAMVEQNMEFFEDIERGQGI